MGVSTTYDRGVLAEEITVLGDGCYPNIGVGWDWCTP